MLELSTSLNAKRFFFFCYFLGEFFFQERSEGVYHSISFAGIDLGVRFVGSHGRGVGVPVYFYHSELCTGLSI